MGVEARGLSFHYPDGTNALSDVDFVVHPHECVALLAANGSGKTTLLKLLTGLLAATSGEVRLGGRTLADWPPRERFQQVGLVFQEPDDQLFGATIGEDVAFGPRNLGLDEVEVARRVVESLEAVGAAHLRARPVHHLSFGERKRACVAGVLAMRPATLILDEPTAGLDPAGEAAMLRLLRALNEQGTTVVMATHSVDLLPLFVHRVCVLHRGRKIADGTPASVFSRDALLQEAGLRLPYVARLFEELRDLDGLDVGDLPLTVGEARRRLLELLPIAGTGQGARRP